MRVCNKGYTKHSLSVEFGEWRVELREGSALTRFTDRKIISVLRILKSNKDIIYSNKIKCECVAINS